jgi:uncharacterized membrane protein (TIGR02234 family)
MFAIALATDLVGGAAALLLAGRSWQSVVVPRQPPLADDVVRLSGRTLDAAVTGLALVALAGIVAVLATRGLARQIVGVLIALSGLLLGWRAIGDIDRVSASRALSLVTGARGSVGVDSSSVAQVTTQPAWPMLTAGAAALIVAAGALVASLGAGWSSMSSRYDAPAPASRPQGPQADEAIWSALDRGTDPTTGPE